MNCLRKSNASRRRAISLAELLVVMSACTIILSMSAMLIHRAMHTYSNTRAFLDDERSALRLFDQFRRDVHQATDAAIASSKLDGARPPDELLQLSLPDGNTIEYVHAAGLVTRILRQHDAPVSREEFSFPRHIALAVSEEAAPRRLVMTMTTQSETPAAADVPKVSRASMAPMSLRVEACLGRSARFPVLPAPQENPE